MLFYFLHLFPPFAAAADPLQSMPIDPIDWLGLSGPVSGFFFYSSRFSFSSRGISLTEVRKRAIKRSVPSVE